MNVTRKVQKKMGYGYARSPKKSVVGKIIKYIVFDIVLACLPLLADCLLCWGFDLKIDSIYDYCNQICVMTIVLSATSIKGSIEWKIFNKKPKVFWLIIASSISIIVVSIFMYGIMEYSTLSNMTNNISKEKPFILFVLLYAFSFLIGFFVQIGGGIDG